jgi:hypothetical protein
MVLAMAGWSGFLKKVLFAEADVVIDKKFFPFGDFPQA